MNRVIKTAIRAALLMGATPIFISCQGRTMDNMQPTGDTVEVQITSPTDTADTAYPATDSASATPTTTAPAAAPEASTPTAAATAAAPEASTVSTRVPDR